MQAKSCKKPLLNEIEQKLRKNALVCVDPDCDGLKMDPFHFKVFIEICFHFCSLPHLDRNLD